MPGRDIRGYLEFGFFVVRHTEGRASQAGVVIGEWRTVMFFCSSWASAPSSKLPEKEPSAESTAAPLVEFALVVCDGHIHIR